MRHQAKTALVSGAGQGLGRAIALRLAAEGARVAVNDRQPSENVEQVVHETGGIAAIADVSDPDAVNRMVAAVEERLGPVDVLVANHAYMTMAPFLEHDPEDWWRNIDVNLSGTFFLIRAVLPAIVLDQYEWTPLDNWRLNRAARFGQVVGGDFSEDQWLLDRMPYRMPLGGLYMSNGVWPVGLSWMAAGYNAAHVIAVDAGVRDQPWWRARPCEWYLGNLDRLLAPIELRR